MQLIESSALRYAELFFHVFAHVAGTRGLPSSVFSSRYVDWARARLGEPASRTLAEDARLLADAFPTHQALAGIQPLARLFASPARLSSVGSASLSELRPERPARLSSVGSASLSELRPEQVDDADALSHVQRLGAAAELAFCALTLELPYFLRLPAPPTAPRGLLERLSELVPLAPALSEARVGCVRALHRHGRAWGCEIWLGHPDAEVAPTLEHAAWQAAHEASVVAVARAKPSLSERQIEAEAVTRLSRAARTANRRIDHENWLATVRSLV